MNKKPEDIKVILATDCGSTTTKAILIMHQDGEYRLVVRGEAPTTVEAPFEDVTMGVLNAVTEVSELAGRKLVTDDEKILRPSTGNDGTDIFISTSSAGGGLQMMVAGVVRTMTAKSAENAALGAGAIVMDVIASNDKRLPHEQIERIRQLRPDMILLSGGIDGGTVSHVVELGELIGAADPRPRLGIGYHLPVIYAGNIDARENVNDILGEKVDLRIVDNIRPVLEEENLKPAREMIHNLFMEHVMAQAPGYKKLMSWADAPIMPTPGAVGLIMKRVADEEGIQVLGVDIGGATTDVFSVFNNPAYDIHKDENEIDNPKTIFNRTVSANLGMSYSISNVFKETGIENVLRWIPFEMDEVELRNQVKNKMIRPTTIPQALETLMFEQALAREALRLAFIQHQNFATTLKGVQKQRTISETFEQSEAESLVNLLGLDILIGSGGVLSHAPKRNQSAIMMLDAFQPQGLTMLAVDSIFMMPQLGVLSTIHPKAATEVFHKDCLIYLGDSLSPVGTGKPGSKVGAYKLTMPDGKTHEGLLLFGDMKKFALGIGETAKLSFEPSRGFDCGEGKGKKISVEVRGGVVGFILDGRGRPLIIPEAEAERVASLKKWLAALEVYPENTLNG
ncbi:MAG TPA: methylaspartate mutase [candidate division Zixibacteria bacterium]|nr:methylaspartate mutase [candidate division Zixibacteria bacterium]